MSRLIDADALILALKTQDYSGSPESLEDWTPQDMTKAEIADINNAPTIDAEPVRHGKWIELNTELGIFLDFDEVKCSECGFVEYFNKGWARFKYCPTCGAKMEDEENEGQTILY